MWNQRSVDTFLGLPFNISSYGLLLMLLGKLTNMVPDELIGNLGDTHLYLNHIEQAKEQINRKSYELPWVELDFNFKFIDGYLVNWSKIDVNNVKLVNYLSGPAIKAPLSN
jgi:thymidylate synthase